MIQLETQAWDTKNRDMQTQRNKDCRPGCVDAPIE